MNYFACVKDLLVWLRKRNWIHCDPLCTTKPIYWQYIFQKTTYKKYEFIRITNIDHISRLNIYYSIFSTFFFTLLISIVLSLASSTGFYWNCWSYYLRSLKQWPRPTVWCWLTCNRSWCRAHPGHMKRASNSMSRRMSPPRSRQYYRSGIEIV